MERIDWMRRHATRVLLLLALSFPLASCTQRHTLSREDLRSDLASAISIASETEMSIGFVEHEQATSSFARGHFQYLAQQLRDSMKDISGSTPAAGLEQNVRSSQAQIDALSRALAALDAKNAASLESAKEQVRAVRKALEDENASL
jgi:hypothetical protein